MYISKSGDIIHTKCLPARAYFMASDDETENLTRAETVLQELVSTVDQAEDRVRKF